MCVSVCVCVYVSVCLCVCVCVCSLLMFVHVCFCFAWMKRTRRRGARTVALKTPLDLSAFDGVAMSCGFESDDEPQRRTWKATLRTQNNRGEVVYQATFVPPVSSSDSNEKPAEVRIPWESFRLVRGPVVRRGGRGFMYEYGLKCSSVQPTHGGL